MSDYIRRSDAIDAVQDHFNANGFKGYDDGQKMMDRIKALPSAELPNGDLISRADAIESMANAIWHYPNELYADLNDYNMAEALAKDGLMSVTSQNLTKPNKTCEVDLINRADAIEVISKHSDLPFAWWKMICRELKDLPSADAVSREHHDMEIKELKHQIKDQAEMVSVVRCKECKWYMLTDHNDTEVCTNKQWDISMAVYPIISADDYCSHGERREE